MVLPLDTSGSKNAVQAVGTSVSYGKRYVMCAMLNIATRGEDDDGISAAPKATVTAMQAGQIGRLLAQCSEHANEWFNNTWGDQANVHKDAFDRLMANLKAALAKASADKAAQVAVSGELSMSSFQKQDGTPGQSLEMRITEIDLIGGGGQQQGQQDGYQPQQPVQQRPPQYQPQHPNQYAQQSGGTAAPQHGALQGFDDFDDEIPF